MPDKHHHRQRSLASLRAINPSQRKVMSEAICQRLLLYPLLADAPSVFVYASSDDEVQTLTLIQELIRLGKRVSVPRIDDKQNAEMSAVIIDSLDQLAIGPFGIASPPTGNPIDPAPALALMPGLAFDPVHGTRLGRGGGYYDRWLAKHPETARVGLAFTSQLINDLPAEPHDLPMNAAVTDSSLIEFA